MKEIASLRDRLLMGQEAYKEKYIEWERVQDELYRQQQLQRQGVCCSSPVAISTLLQKVQAVTKFSNVINLFL